MKLGYLTTKFPPVTGGGETHMATIAHEMSKLGHDVEVITGTHDGRNPESFPYVVRQIEGLHDHATDPTAHETLTRLLESAELDVLHIVNYEGLRYFQGVRQAGRIAARKTVFSAHNTPLPPCVSNPTAPTQNPSNGADFTGIDTFIANSQTFRDSLLRQGIASEGIVSVPFGINTSVFRPAHEKPNSDAVKILCTSRFIARKGIGFLLAAMEQLPEEYTLHLTGSGTVHDQPVHDRLVDQANQLGERITLAPGRTSLSDLVRLYQEAQVFAIPSQFEGFGLSALEAMACGTPVVATDVQGLEEFVRHEQTGLLVDYGNPCQLAAAIRRVAEDTTLQQELVKNALTLTNIDFNFESMVKRYSAVYEQVGAS